MIRWRPLMLCLTLLAGCGEGDPGYKEISGMVTFQGAPVATGKIELLSADGTSTLANAEIRNGQYKIPAVAALRPGQYRVSIVSMLLRSDFDEPGKRPAEMPEVVDIPKKYNTRSELKVDVGDAPQQTHDFELQ